MRRRIVTLVALVFSAALLLAPTASATPRILSVKFAQGAVSGRPLDFDVRATDAAAPVTGMIAGFGAGSGFGSSACAIDSAGHVLSPTGAVSLSAPHTFTYTGRKDLAATVTSGGCAPGATSTLQQIVADVVALGTAPKPLVLGAPVALNPSQPAPLLPGLGSVPLPPGSVPALPPTGLPTVPTVPLPTVPSLPKLPILTAGIARRRCPGAANKVRNTAASQAKARKSLLCLNNYERRRRGLRAMRANQHLTQAALGHSRRMVQLRFFAHVGPGTLGLSSRLRRSRYLPSRGGTWFVGENIAFGSGRAASPLAIHRAWMRSTPHRENILRSKFREVGFGIYGGAPFGSRGVTYTADFGRLGHHR